MRSEFESLEKLARDLPALGLRQWAFSLERSKPCVCSNICIKTPCVFTEAAYVVASLAQEFTQA